jgi:hypothetical protein
MTYTITHDYWFSCNLSFQLGPCVVDCSSFQTRKHYKLHHFIDLLALNTCGGQILDPFAVCQVGAVMQRSCFQYQQGSGEFYSENNTP